MAKVQVLYKFGLWVLLVWVLVWFGFCLIIIHSVIEHLGHWVGSEWDRHIFSAPKSSVVRGLSDISEEKEGSEREKFQKTLRIYIAHCLMINSEKRCNT